MSNQDIFASSSEVILCCVSSFLQYLNAIEYVLRFHENREKVLVVYLTDNNSRLKRFVNRSASDYFKKIEYIEKRNISFRRNPFKALVKIHNEKRKLKKILDSQKYAQLVIGHSNEAFYPFGYLSKFFIEEERLVIVDDGTKTSLFLSDEKVFQDLIKKGKKSIHSLIWGIDGSYQALATFFTVYDDPRCESVKDIIRNDYRRLSAMNNPSSQIRSEAHFVGQPLLSDSFMSDNAFLKELKLVYRYLNSKVENVVYFAHPRETNDELDVARSIGYIVLELDCPYEMYFLESSIKPTLIAGFFSTALANIKKLQNSDLSVLSFDISRSIVCPEKRKPVEKIYSELARNNQIKPIFLP